MSKLNIPNAPEAITFNDGTDARGRMYLEIQENNKKICFKRNQLIKLIKTFITPEGDSLEIGSSCIIEKIIQDNGIYFFEIIFPSYDYEMPLRLDLGYFYQIKESSQNHMAPLLNT